MGKQRAGIRGKPDLAQRGVARAEGRHLGSLLIVLGLLVRNERIGLGGDGKRHHADRALGHGCLGGGGRGLLLLSGGTRSLLGLGSSLKSCRKWSQWIDPQESALQTCEWRW